MMMVTHHPGSASHWVLYIYSNISNSQAWEGKKSLSGIFPRCIVSTSLPQRPIDTHRLLSVREGGDEMQLLGSLGTSSLAAHASVIMAVSHIAG